MSDVVIASDRADAEAAERMVEHHAELAGRLTALVRIASRAETAEDVRGARDRMVAWARTSLLPHAEAEERSLYPAAAELAELTTLVREMVAEHGVVRELVDKLARATEPGEMVAAAGALEAVLGTHLHKENDVVLPALVSSADHSLAELLDGMHELLGTAATEGATEEAAGHACACGHEDGGAPELDARTIPHAIRHATIFGALDTVAPGHDLVLVAPHDPLPLLAQLEQRAPGAFDVEYLEQGPETWRLRFRRRT